MACRLWDKYFVPFGLHEEQKHWNSVVRDSAAFCTSGLSELGKQFKIQIIKKAFLEIEG